MLTLKQIDSRISSLRKGGYSTVNEKVQEVAVSIVSHANDFNDCSRAPKLVRCVPPQMRPLLVAWFTNVSPINVNLGKTAKDDKVSLRKPFRDKKETIATRNYNPFDIDKAKANLWSDNPFNAEPPAQSLKSFNDIVESFSKRFTTMANMTKIDAGKIVPEDIADVQALRACMRDAMLTFVKNREEGAQEEAAAKWDETEVKPEAAPIAA